MLSSVTSILPTSTCDRLLHRHHRLLNSSSRCLPIVYGARATHHNMSRHRPVILLWTSEPRFGAADRDSEVGLPCRISTDRRDVSRAAAIVFHTPSMLTNEAPPPYCGQRWVAWHPVPRDLPNSGPRVAVQLDHRVMMQRQQCADAFDFSSGYRLDTTVPDLAFPLHGARHAARLFAPIPSHVMHKRNDTFVVALVTDCAEPGSRQRLRYIRQLRRHLPVDVIGDCLGAGTPALPMPSPGDLPAVLRPYKFVISFEPALCPDFVSDRLFVAFSVGTVPVVLGPTNVRVYSPTPQAVINVLEEGPPARLAERLWALHRNTTLYLHHLSYKFNASAVTPAYRRRFLEQDASPQRRLCDLVRGGFPATKPSPGVRAEPPRHKCYRVRKDHWGNQPDVVYTRKSHGNHVSQNLVLRLDKER
jgi:hypothetical protein